MSTMQPLRSPGGGESGGLAVSAEDTFVRLWEGWGEPPQPGSGRAQNQAVVSRVLLWLRGVSPRHQAGFSCSFVETGLFSFDFFFSPFGFFVLLQVSIVNLTPWEILLHLRHGTVGVHGTSGWNPIPGLLEARLEALWYVQWDGLGQ